MTSIISKLTLDCGCEIELIGSGGKMSMPCSIHFSRHKVSGFTPEVEELVYRIGIEGDDEDGSVFRYFPSLEGAEKYWNEKNCQANGLAFQRKGTDLKGNLTWKDIN